MSFCLSSTETEGSVRFRLPAIKYGTFVVVSLVRDYRHDASEIFYWPTPHRTLERQMRIAEYYYYYQNLLSQP